MDKQVLGFRLLEQVGQLILAVVGVYGEQNGPDFGRGEHQGHPVGHVVGPQGHLVAFFNAQAHQSLGQFIHRVFKFRPCLAVVAVHIDHRVSIRKPGHRIVQNLPQGKFPQFKFRFAHIYT